MKLSLLGSALLLCAGCGGPGDLADGGTGGGKGGGGGAGGGTGGPKTGFVFVEEDIAGASAFTTAGAVFLEGTPSSNCTSVLVEGCTVMTCSSPTDGGPYSVHLRAW